MTTPGTAVSVTLDGEQMRELMGGAILSQLSENARQQILTEAVNQLITPRKGDYGRTLPSPLQAAFDGAVNNLAREVARELIEEHPEIREKIKVEALAAIETLLKDYNKGETLRQMIERALAQRDG